ncbi:hypothetical protein E2C01_045439 [Portunus trituberculatus]|uniref:Uncharacterized protein n=1 Tax=Portunus trituberculatus TaxID=210409 RepID=A0A5B7FV02_PORTR|nr:hypothetical protein [Portunus trituberculatus]
MENIVSLIFPTRDTSSAPGLELGGGRGGGGGGRGGWGVACGEVWRVWCGEVRWCCSDEPSKQEADVRSIA